MEDKKEQTLVDPKTQKHFDFKIFSLLIVVLFSAIILTNLDKFKDALNKKLPVSNTESLVKFKNEDDFNKYLSDADKLTENLNTGTTVGIGEQLKSSDMTVTPVSPTTELNESQRYSQTNVQVARIDEPDIVKNDGSNIYLSSQSYFLTEPLIENIKDEEIKTRTSAQPSQEAKSKTEIISAFPIEKLKKLSSIENQGNLLLADKKLVIVDEKSMIAYDVTDPASPILSWQIDFEDDVFLSGIRQYENKIVVLTQKRVITSKPCPVVITQQPSFEMTCNDIYHPIKVVPFDSVFTLLEISFDNGLIQNKVSFTGASNLTVSYFSDNFAYITYTNYGNVFDFLLKFFVEDGKDLLGVEFNEKVAAINKYDISQQAKMTELEVVMQEAIGRLSEDDVLAFQNNMQNALNSYSKNHIRDQEVTTIVKISLDDFNVKSTGSVPGRPLNQFSMDENKDLLRIATTVGMGNVGSNINLNDLYVLDTDMSIKGKIQGLAEDERIYAVRFIDDKAYMVTFKQIDPFFVLDLSDATNPKVAGELKIPGYSSYLHELDKNVILGVGMEDNKVKVAIYDVKDAGKPQEISKYVLDEYYSETNINHHAFLQDSEKKIFFITGTKGGYIFSYFDNNLKLTKAVRGENIQRALYINDYLYMIFNNKITVIDENSWEVEKELLLH